MEHFYRAIIGHVSNIQSKLVRIENIEGGCIHHAVKVVSDQQSYFIKSNRHALDMFEAEAKGLQLLYDLDAIGIPEVLGLGTVDGQDYLCLTFIDKSTPTSNYWYSFGESLAKIHRTPSDRFGLDHDNFIGSLAQSNTFHTHWIEFFVQERLQPQLLLAKNVNLVAHRVLDDFEKLFMKLPELIPTEPPAMLHGDLWSGNIMCGSSNQPFIFDPAVYFGHREAELSFTKLFGGFAPAFYQAYQSNFPLQQGYEQRVDLFNLYPLLVHVNLFGQSYLPAIIRTLKRLV